MEGINISKEHSCYDKLICADHCFISFVEKRTVQVDKNSFFDLWILRFFFEVIFKTFIHFKEIVFYFLRQSQGNKQRKNILNLLDKLSKTLTRDQKRAI